MQRILRESLRLTIFIEFWPEDLRRAGSGAIPLLSDRAPTFFAAVTSTVVKR